MTDRRRSGPWAAATRLPTGAKLFLILSAALLPLAVIALVATLQTNRNANAEARARLDVALHETALDLLGPEAELESTWLDGYTFSLSGPIYAGTNEIQRNIVAERILNLPREPKGAAR